MIRQSKADRERVWLDGLDRGRIGDPTLVKAPAKWEEGPMRQGGGLAVNRDGGVMRPFPLFEANRLPLPEFERSIQLVLPWQVTNNNGTLTVSEGKILGYASEAVTADSQTLPHYFHRYTLAIFDGGDIASFEADDIVYGKVAIAQLTDSFYAWSLNYDVSGMAGGVDVEEQFAAPVQDTTITVHADAALPTPTSDNWLYFEIATITEAGEISQTLFDNIAFKVDSKNLTLSP